MKLSDFRPMLFSVSEEDGIAVVRFPTSRITDEMNVEQLGHDLFAIVEQFQHNKIIIDLSGIELVSSSVLGKLITLHRRLHRGEGKVVLTNAGPYLTEILKTSRLHDYFHVAANPAVARQILNA
jgi:anti-sigma B factor antagonist